MNVPHEPTYFMDRDLGLRFADALKSAGLRVEHRPAIYDRTNVISGPMS